MPSNTVLTTKKKQKEAIEKTKKYYIRVFHTSFKGTPARLRSSENYTKALNELQRERLKNPNLLNEEKNELLKGYLGPCSLTRLGYFDHGQSFLSDSLHTVYGGAVV